MNIVTKCGAPVARTAPEVADRSANPQWRAAYEDLVASLRAKPATGFRVGRITEEDLND